MEDHGRTRLLLHPAGQFKEPESIGKNPMLPERLLRLSAGNSQDYRIRYFTRSKLLRSDERYWRQFEFSSLNRRSDMNE
jgi:hypothetical protein